MTPGAALLVRGESATRLAGVSWRVRYAAVLGAGSARLQGWLTLESRREAPIEAAEVAIAGPERRGPELELGLGLSLPARGRLRRPLFAEPRQVPARVRRIFDPVGDRLDHEGVHPVVRESYGSAAEPERLPVALAAELDLAAAGLEALPPGPTELRGRRGGFAAEGPRRIELGQAPGLFGRRWQSDYGLDRDRRRLVEEIRVELENRSGAAVRVDVREHLYRGRSWTVAYHNQVGRIAKAGPQEIRFDLELPAGARRRIVYRVVYHW